MGQGAEQKSREERGGEERGGEGRGGKGRGGEGKGGEECTIVMTASPPHLDNIAKILNVTLFCIHQFIQNIPVIKLGE